MGLSTVAQFFLLVCRIGHIHGDKVCVDNEANIASHSTTNLLHFSVTNSVKDLRQRMGTSRYRSLTGRSQVDVATKFNLYAAGHASVSRVVPCSDLTSSEVASLAQKLKLLTDDKVSLLFPEADGRQLYVDPAVASFFDTPALHDLQCTETMKLWAHHIPDSVKEATHASFVLPTVPIINATELIKENEHFNRTVSCVAGHTVVATELTDQEEDADVTDWPRWPREFHYRAKAYGPYPFWLFGPGPNPNHTWAMAQTNEEMYAGSDIEVWISTSRRATKFYHANCVWHNLRYDNLGQAPCVVMHTGIFENYTHPSEPAGSWFIYEANAPTTRSRFCCKFTQTATLVNQNLGTLNRRFVDNMKYVGNVSYHGRHYDGIAKQYVLAMEGPVYGPQYESEPKLPLTVWYETDLDDRPLRFAEIGSGSTFPEDLNLVSRDYPLIWEEFDHSSFDSELSDDLFQPPEECLSMTWC
jgi:hypothetical protein